MKATATLLGLVLLSAGGLNAQTNFQEQFTISGGPKVGQTVKMTKTEVAADLVVKSQGGQTIRLKTNGYQTNALAELSAFRHEVTRIADGKEWPYTCYEFQIGAKSGGISEWSCWEGGFPTPHRFQIITTESGNNYACLVAGGVELFHVTNNRPSQTMRDRFFSHEKHPDAVPVLAEPLLFEPIGRANMDGLGAQKLDITVDSLSEKAGELRVTLHGTTPTPQCTYALRNDKWVLLQ